MILRGTVVYFLPYANMLYFKEGGSMLQSIDGSGHGEFVIKNVHASHGSGRGNTYNRIYHWTDCNVDISVHSRQVPKCPY